jgi:hypothetical protein
LSRRNDQEVRFRLKGCIYGVGPGVERDAPHDLDELRLVVARRLDGIQLGFARMAALANRQGDKANGRLCRPVNRGCARSSPWEALTCLRLAFADFGTTRAQFERAIRRSRREKRMPAVSGPLLSDIREIGRIVEQWSRSPAYIESDG